MPAIEVRDFKQDDLHELMWMWRRSFEHGVGVKDPHSLEAQIAYFEKEIVPNNRVRLAWKGGALAGFLASNAESVAQLYVHVENIGEGIGSRLLELAKGDSSGSLWLYTFARNLDARRFYERHGFVASEFGFEPSWQLDDVKYVWTRGEDIARAIDGSTSALQ